MKWSEISAEQYEQHCKYVNERWSDLSDMTKERSRDALRMLFLTNAGGAVAILTFIGAAPTVRMEIWPWVMLGFFCLGIILLQIFHGVLYYKLIWMFESWRKDTILLFADKMSWQSMQDADNKRADRFVWFDGFPIASGLCFAGAVLIGFISFNGLIEKERINGNTHQAATTSSAVTTPGAERPSSPQDSATTTATSEEVKKPAQ